MARVVRADVFDPREVSVFHCLNRCVRRCFLCGQDRVTGQDYEHRKAWIERRLGFLAGVYGIDVLGFAVMSNHFHVILRNRPDVVATWSDREVAERWWRLCPERKEEQGLAVAPTEADLSRIYADAERLAEIRLRLSDISWFMRSVAEPIARRANAEEGCSGRFWQGRFKSVKLCDEAAILACSVYVDLNPVRAGVAETPEGSEHTSARRRIDAVREQERVGQEQVAREQGECGANTPATSTVSADDWLAPLVLEEGGMPGPAASTLANRASDKGFLPLSLPEYLELLDWTGRQVAEGKRGVVPASCAPILERVGIPCEAWLKLSLGFGQIFRRVAGCPAALAAEQARREGRRFRTPGAAIWSRGAGSSSGAGLGSARQRC